MMGNLTSEALQNMRDCMPRPMPLIFVSAFVDGVYKSDQNGDMLIGRRQESDMKKRAYADQPTLSTAPSEIRGNVPTFAGVQILTHEDALMHPTKEMRDRAGQFIPTIIAARTQEDE